MQPVILSVLKYTDSPEIEFENLIYLIIQKICDKII